MSILIDKRQGLTYVLLICGLGFIPTLACADDDSRLVKMAKVVEKDGRCEFAVAKVTRPAFVGHPLGAPRTTVFCVGTITLNAGTLNERSGCAAFALDLNTLKTGFFWPSQRVPHIVEGKTCTEDAFNQLMRIKGGLFNQTPLGDLFTFAEPGFSRGETVTELTIIYPQGNTFFHRWFNAQRPRVAAVIKEVEIERRKIADDNAKEIQAEKRWRAEELERQKVFDKKRNKQSELWK